MKDTSRRTFVKRTALATVAVGSLGSVKASAARDTADSGCKDVLYHETAAWKRYYKTLV
jgi:hypothetical protein